ncbi:sensor histidine kinase [Xanthomonas arboricola]|uniref:histidine kinase n=4 Tax=Xanthomonas TaxID=338 RepID=A0A8D6UMQ2_9XANT|nr:ATP-binding protein [Xanthomonas arboricola]WIX24209.1 ATP-binding protein [Xanthomonas arboricola pv. corylina]CAE6715515.1 Adaptive-response sensory-kinase SasA [Xanthomonas arboricola pv. corylina]CAE6715542.1 Adaptive-response sensory-kinase SasA [Xanthomonas arboricola pv. corylina]CAE6716048.1 Adaptive-response sensory-kinase SasA [Xanthomonas arboricola pv. corylina]CAE6716068.1 Adaptive-response sensory-kinase SasA [Xanthomonas arboricola pv. corylina]
MQTTVQEDRWDRWRLPLLAVAVFLIVVVPSLLLQQMARNANQAAVWVSHSQEVQETVQRLEAAMRDTESAALMRSHGVQRPALLERMRRGRRESLAAVQRLIVLTKDNPAQQVRMGRIQSTIERRLLLAERIAVTTAPEQIRLLINDMTLNNPIRVLIDELQDAEGKLLELRNARADTERAHYAVLSWGTLLVQLLLLGTVTWLLQRQIRRRLAAEQEYLRANGRASSVLQTVREPIVLLDSGQRILLHNPAFAELYGLDERGNESMPLEDVGGGVWRDAQIHQRLADVLLRGRELWDYEHEQRAADGVLRTMLINARRMPLPDTSDEDVVLMTVSDISLQKASQLRIQELNRQMEGKVEQVSEVNRELEAFSYSVSHDLRAPLRHVAGFSDKLARHLGDAADEKSRHYMEVISSSARRMASLIDDLLVYSRLGRSALRLQAVDMQSLVSETRAILDSNVQSENTGHRVDWHIAPLPVLVADENMMRQLWMNLLGNAVKYSTKREVARIEVTYTPMADGGHQFSVRDNGAGFDMEYSAKLFGVFQRLHKASEYPGTGIGLASVRRVLTRHGGRVWAEGAVDEGATFYFVLPPALEAPNQEFNV